ncbi:MAG: hypothetical protein AVDCRST_MAG86-2936 [uncultured Truepera sp.]|uniref:Uncharacterized protein n=1 Tax=uncultured Truepera sp. TaxID=543023 RepID=A0A6J4VGX9_9DEIN|nr:MAG: hypothetical protein AVDCRST_MAG86-2936 [uncultured Truepera sp.]
MLVRHVVKVLLVVNVVMQNFILKAIWIGSLSTRVQYFMCITPVDSF